MRAILTIVSCLLLAGASQAQLKWDTQRVELTPLLTDASVDAKFAFVNAGNGTVTIENVQSSCGCTIPTLAKKTYAPGERGEILARFNIGDRRGVQDKTIRVSVQGEREPAVLSLIVKIPESAEITPTMLVWERGEANKSKTISVKALPNQPLRILQVTPSITNIKAQVTTIQEAKEYLITVTPESTATPGFVLLTIDALLMGQKKTLTAYAQIRPAAK